MSCPHSLYGSPSTCSQCASAKPRRVEIRDGMIAVDGVGERVNNEPDSVQVTTAQRRARGQARSGIKRRK